MAELSSCSGTVLLALLDVHVLTELEVPDMKLVIGREIVDEVDEMTGLSYLLRRERVGSGQASY